MHLCLNKVLPNQEVNQKMLKWLLVSTARELARNKFLKYRFTKSVNF